ncbi:nitroreductase family protein [Nocardia sp. CA-135398]|uniref:nitroreductase family protein n=1 Tax=Nocardia sp. CA-135398 TaxID=3239977 RepID=UPI003D9859E3
MDQPIAVSPVEHTAAIPPDPKEEATRPPASDLYDVMSTMRAMRRLKPEPVPREVIERLIRAASWAPSGGNSQTARYIVVDDRTQIARIAPLCRRAQRFYITAQADACPPTMSPEQFQRTLAAGQHLADHFEDVPALIVVCCDVSSNMHAWLAHTGSVARAFRDLGIRRAVTGGANFAKFGRLSIAASVYPAVQNLLLAARESGLGASLTTTHLMFERELKDILGLPRNVRTFALVPIGYPLGRFGPVNRAPVEHFLQWNHWQQRPE